MKPVGIRSCINGGILHEDSIFKSLGDDYSSGKFSRLKDDLVHYIENNHEVIRNRVIEIRELPELADVSSNGIVEMAIKELILDCWVIHPQADAKAQIEEIERHLWLVGEKNSCPPDRDVEISYWIKNHAENWREYRLLAILFVFQKNIKHYLQLLRATGEFEGLIES